MIRGADAGAFNGAANLFREIGNHSERKMERQENEGAAKRERMEAQHDQVFQNLQISANEQGVSVPEYLHLNPEAFEQYLPHTGVATADMFDLSNRDLVQAEDGITPFPTGDDEYSIRVGRKDGGDGILTRNRTDEQGDPAETYTRAEVIDNFITPALARRGILNMTKNTEVMLNERGEVNGVEQVTDGENFALLVTGADGNTDEELSAELTANGMTYAEDFGVSVEEAMTHVSTAFAETAGLDQQAGGEPEQAPEPEPTPQQRVDNAAPGELTAQNLLAARNDTSNLNPQQGQRPAPTPEQPAPQPDQNILAARNDTSNLDPQQGQSPEPQQQIEADVDPRQQAFRRIGDLRQEADLTEEEANGLFMLADGRGHRSVGDQQAAFAKLGIDAQGMGRDEREAALDSIINPQFDPAGMGAPATDSGNRVQPMPQFEDNGDILRAPSGNERPVSDRWDDGVATEAGRVARQVTDGVASGFSQAGESLRDKGQMVAGAAGRFSDGFNEGEQPSGSQSSNTAQPDAHFNWRNVEPGSDDDVVDENAELDDDVAEAAMNIEVIKQPGKTMGMPNPQIDRHPERIMGNRRYTLAQQATATALHYQAQGQQVPPAMMQTFMAKADGPQPKSRKEVLEEARLWGQVRRAELDYNIALDNHLGRSEEAQREHEAELHEQFDRINRAYVDTYLTAVSGQLNNISLRDATGKVTEAQTRTMYNEMVTRNSAFLQNTLGVPYNVNSDGHLVGIDYGRANHVQLQSLLDMGKQAMMMDGTYEGGGRFRAGTLREASGALNLGGLPTTNPRDERVTTELERLQQDNNERLQEIMGHYYSQNPDQSWVKTMFDDIHSGNPEAPRELLSAYSNPQ